MWILILILIEICDYIYEYLKFRKYTPAPPCISFPSEMIKFLEKLKPKEEDLLNKYEIFEKLIDYESLKHVNKPWHVLVIIKVILTIKQACSLWKLRKFKKISYKCVDVYHLRRGGNKVVILQHGMFAFTDNMITLINSIPKDYDIIIPIVRFIDYSYFHRYGDVNDYIKIMVKRVDEYHEIKIICHSAGSIFIQHLYPHIKEKAKKEIFVESNSLNISIIGGIVSYKSMILFIYVLNAKRWSLKYTIGAYILKGWPSYSILRSIFLFGGHQFEKRDNQIHLVSSCDPFVDIDNLFMIEAEILHHRILKKEGNHGSWFSNPKEITRYLEEEPLLF